MERGFEGILFLMLLFGLLHLTRSSSLYDPYRRLLSHGKPAIQSSTEGSHVASYATDGDFNNYDLPINYSQTTISDNPYLQVDLGQSVFVSAILLAFPILVPETEYTDIKITLGADSAIDSSANSLIAENKKVKGWLLKYVKKWGRYVTVQRMASNTNLDLCEVAVYDIPIESWAFRKSTGSGSSALYGKSNKAVDMSLNTHYMSKEERQPWLRVNLDDVYFVHEVVMLARLECCAKKRLLNFDIRIGNSLLDNGNNNPLCGKADMYTGEIRSFYCNMFGKYVNIFRDATNGKCVLQFSEVIINPETTANVVRNGASASCNVEYRAPYVIGRVIEMIKGTYFQTVDVFSEKQVVVDLQASYDIVMIHIPGIDVTEFDVRVGTGVFSESTQCTVSGLQTTDAGYAWFYCLPRITGSKVFVHQYKKDRVMKMWEIAVFEETKPAFVDIKTDRYIWAEENKDITLTCDAKGYPAPVLSWVKNKKVIKSSSSTLQLTGVTFNESEFYECWANNTHGVTARQFEVKITSNLRICVESLEMKYMIGKSTFIDMEINGHHWYRIYDPQGQKSLQFHESAPGKHVSSCQVWLNGKHPKVKDGVVSRTLCVKNEINDCSTTIDVYIRTCATHFIYNFKHLMSTSGLKFCFKNAPNSHGGINPSMASPVTNHALSNTVFQTEPEVKESYQCLMMCQLDKRCKSFNFSKKFKVCELNTATKKEYPENYGYRADYSYYHMGSGMVVNVKREL